MKLKCPVCGAAELVRDTRDIPYTYNGESTVIPDVTGDFFPACGESVLDMAQSVRVGEAVTAFNKQVNAAIVDPKFISVVRKKLSAADVDQEQQDVLNSPNRRRRLARCVE